MSTSSSSDEDRERLLEALDPQFLVAEEKISKSKSNGKCTAVSAGILLFASSTTPCVVSDRTIKPQMQVTKKRKAPSESSSSSEDEDKFKQVAVSGDWVLKKRGVYHEDCPQPADIIIPRDEQ